MRLRDEKGGDAIGLHSPFFESAWEVAWQGVRKGKGREGGYHEGNQSVHYEER